MTDCSETEIRDLLPDYVSGSLLAAESELVAEHIATCTACAEEVALLRVVRAIRPVPMALDASAMVARIRRETGSAASSEASGIRNITSAPSRQRAVRYGSWRWAAAITVIALGGMSAIIARRGQQGMLPVASVDSLMPASSAIAPSPGVGATAPSQPVSSGRTSNAPAVVSSERAALSVGELSDYSDAELEGVIKKLEAWDGTASPDPLLPVPIVKPSGGAP